MANITCFGEVLWDFFPTHKKIGGAPLNVAIRLQSLDNEVTMISRIGADTKGQKILDFMRDQGINTANIQTDEKLKTGTVEVLLDTKGSASYTIKSPRAWDNIQLTESAKKTVAAADAFVFGSLSSRNEPSKNTLYALLKLANYKIFDVNLRAPHYTSAGLIHLMNTADFIKFNDDELFEIAKVLGSKSPSLEQNILYIATHTTTTSICVTKGRHGAVLYHNDTFYYNSGYQITVVDTVGAGDSFLASLITKLLKETPPQLAINFACAVGAMVSGSKGANPQISEDDIEKFMNA